MRASDKFWLCWTLLFLGSFFAKEIPSLIKSDGGTLSEAIWRLESIRGKATPISQWTAGHFLFLGFWLTVGFVWVWLLGHFIFGVWRN